MAMTKATAPDGVYTGSPTSNGQLRERLNLQSGEDIFEILKEGRRGERVGVGADPYHVAGQLEVAGC